MLTTGDDDGTLWLSPKCQQVSWLHLAYYLWTLGKKATIHQVTTILATPKNVLFPRPNHLCWWSDTLIITLALTRAIIICKAPVVSRWLWPGNSYDILEVANILVTWFIVAFLCRGRTWGKNAELGKIHIGYAANGTWIECKVINTEQLSTLFCITERNSEEWTGSLWNNSVNKLG